jgi:nitrite reductase/ring-hydroxylating ferredoxin subunit
MSEKSSLDLTRVVCSLSALPIDSCVGFTIGAGDWPLRGFVVRTREGVHGYVNRCPHAGLPLNLRPGKFLTFDSSLILCSAHGALFEKSTGYCVAGPCAGKSLERIAIHVADGLVLLADDATESQA